MFIQLSEMWSLTIMTSVPLKCDINKDGPRSNSLVPVIV